MSAFITYPVNVDYLIDDVRLRLGDFAGTRYTDTLIRTSLVAGVKSLYRQWNHRYYVFASGLVISPQPSDYPTISGYVYASLPDGIGSIPDGLITNDVFRNPFVTFVDTVSDGVISQEDEYPLILQAAIILNTSQYSSSVSSFQSWSDGEFSFSNIASANAYDRNIGRWADELAAYFKKRLNAGTKGSFPVWNI